jgi:outer membrane protein TolC
MQQASIAVLIAGALMGSIGRLDAQAGRAEHRLSLDEVYRRLDAAAPMLASADAAARAAQARAAVAGTLPDPRIEIGTINRDLRAGGLMAFSGMNMLALRQMLPIPGKLGLAAEAAAARARGAAAQRAVIRWVLRLEAATTYADLFTADRSLAVARETRELVSASGSAAEAMYAVGRGRQADVLRAQTELTRMNEEIIRMGSMRRQLAARLSALMDLPLDPDTLAFDPPPAVAELPPIDSLVRAALAVRPALASARAALEAARTTERLARRDIWPDLELGIQYGWRPMSDATDHMLSLTLGASVPIFAGRRQLRMREEAAAMTAMAASEARAAEADTRGRTIEAWARYEEAGRLTRLYAATLVPQARAALESADAAYRVGAVDYMTVLDNQMTLSRYRQDLYRIHAAASQALATLELLTGAALAEPAAAAEEDRP